MGARMRRLVEMIEALWRMLSVQFLVSVFVFFDSFEDIGSVLFYCVLTSI